MIGTDHSHYLFGWGATLAFIALGVIFVAAPLVILRFIRSTKLDAGKLKTYECGEEPIGDSWVRFNPRFYVIALVFVLFDIEVLFMYPWAVVFGSLPPVGAQAVEVTGPKAPVPTTPSQDPGQIAAMTYAGELRLNIKYALLEMVLFVAILLTGYAYLWRYGYLDWVRSVQVRARREAA
ncbi:MAG: NADH-quinone oxidoreductase subunit A [Candidatus Riflebacteria bacterium]|nr:NADH-quinone oxidoreductase subunit A [Candidatus Riflebacteria bacterium]